VASTAPSRLVGYVASWRLGSNLRIADLPADRLTHIIYAFAGISSAGECVSLAPKVDQVALPELRRLKRIYPALKTSISVGGAGGSSAYPSVAQTVDSRKRFAQSCVTFMTANGLDGIDVDWEFPSASDEKVNLTLLLAELRAQLDRQGLADGAHYNLTIAAPAGPQHYLYLELDKLHQYVDWLNLMAYAFHGTWSTVTNFNAPLFAASSDPSTAIQRLFYNTDGAVQAYLGAGVPADKIVVGVPFYAYGWKGVADVNHGLYQSSGGLPPGTLAPGVFTFADLKSRFLPTYSRYWSDEAKVPWLYDASTGIMITYDDPQSLGVKADYVRSHGLGGAMIWELSGDDADHSLVNALATHLRPDS
jgi:chitinase